MNDSFVVHEMDNRHQFLHKLGGLSLGKALLFPYPLEKLPALQEFHDNIGVGIVLNKE